MKSSVLACCVWMTLTAAVPLPRGLAWQLSYSYNLDAAPSPDGRRLVFIRIVEGREQLFVMGADGKNELQLTRGPVDHEDPIWSPDGRLIAFVKIEGASKVIHTISADGTNDRAITPTSRAAIHPYWFPDGKRIAWCADDDVSPPAKNAASIFATDLETGGTRTLIAGGINTYPSISPDGRRIAFRKIVGEFNSDVFVADIDGRNARNLTNDPAWEGWPAWSPDGTKIAFAGNRNSNYQIFVMNPDGSNVRLVANTEGRATAPRWSPDGSRIYFTNCVSVDLGRGCEVMAALSPID